MKKLALLLLAIMSLAGALLWHALQPATGDFDVTAFAPGSLTRPRLPPPRRSRPWPETGAETTGGSGVFER
jgi:hypothetical protein